MTDDVRSDARASSRSSGRRHRRREVGQADGTTLVLNRDGSIDLLAADRSVQRSWSTVDPEWVTHAFRFGIRPQERTVAPRGPDTGSARPGS
jgi:hypothetical protein